MLFSVPAVASNDPPPMRALDKKVSSMKRMIEAWSVGVLST
jgi:hypothetical protein